MWGVAMLGVAVSVSGGLIAGAIWNSTWASAAGTVPGALLVSFAAIDMLRNL
jgi:hypothetical protein